MLGKFGHFCSTHKSGIFLGLGMALGAGCVVTTAIQTVKASDIIVDANEKLDEINTDLEEGKKEEKKIRRETNLKVVKTYILPAGLGVGSVACILASYKILSSEKAAAVAALSATTAAFEKYRSRVVERFGADVDYELYNGIDNVTITNVDTGESHVVTTKDPIDNNCYSRLFSYETSKEWKANPKRNLAMLDGLQRYWNEQLKCRGYVTYNEVIESLGLSCKVGDGMTDAFIPNGIGWVSSENVPDELIDQIDTFISFAPSKSERLDAQDPWYAGAVYEDAYFLRFNCYPIDGLLARKSQAVTNGEH